jgi:biopolymer transport protein ExbB
VLGTLGNNTPFIGLFGTVLGIIKASHDLTASQATGGQAANAVMAGVFEALVATAVGLLVAIPAVVAYNVFQRRVRAAMSGVDALAHAILSELRGEESTAGAKKDKAQLAEVK